MRGRRVALLLTGVLPLLAEDDVPVVNHGLTTDDENDNDDVSPLQSASKALHDDALERLPDLPVEILQLTSEKPLVLLDSFVLEESLLELGKAIVNSSSGSSGFLQSTFVNASQLKRVSHANRARRPDPHTAVTLDEANEKSDQLRNETKTVEDTETNFEEATGVSSDVGEGVSSEVAEPTETEPDPSADTVMADEEEDESTEQLVVDYASKSAGALILEHSPSMKGTSNLLNGDKDKYAISPCKDKKKVVIGLSEDILVKQVKLANYERYSSQVENFQIWGSQTMGNWADLGTYTAEARNGEQIFNLREPSWARYLKFNFLSHHGSEHYCTVSQIKVHGSTMLQGFHEQWKESEEEKKELLGNEDEAVPDGDSEKDAMRDTNEAASEELGNNGGDTAAEDVESTGDEALSTLDNSKQPPDDADERKNERDEPNEENSANVGESSRAERVAGGASPPSPDDSKECSSIPEQETPCSAESVDQPNDAENEDADRRTSEAAEDLEATGSSSIDSEPESSNSEEKELGPVAIDGPARPPVTGEVKSSSKDEEATAISRASPTHVTDAVASAVKNVVTEASETLRTIKDATTMSEALLEVQQKLKTTISGNVKNGHESTTVTRRDAVEEVTDSSASKTDIEQSETSTEGAATSSATEFQEGHRGSTRESKKGEQDEKQEPPERIDAAASVSSESWSQGSDVPLDDLVNAAEGNASHPGTAPQKGTIARADSDSNSQAELLELMSSLIEKFPSAVCLQRLNYEDFKTKTASRRSGATAVSGSASGAGGGSSGRMEPIFKTLTDEIKTLQISHSVQEQYIRALGSCYQRVIVDVVKELEDTQTRHEARLTDLERRMTMSETRNWTALVSRAFAILVLLATAALALLSRFTEHIVHHELFRQFDLIRGVFFVASLLFVAFGAFLFFSKSDKQAMKIPPTPTTPPLVQAVDDDASDASGPAAGTPQGSGARGVASPARLGTPGGGRR